MVKQSAGILVYRQKDGTTEVLLAHPGGPFWGKKDTWSIPKGEVDEGEDLMAAAKREYEEEVGAPPPVGQLYDLGQSKQGNKTNYIWAVKGDFDINKFKCISTFTLEWPPKSGQQQNFPENDRVKWFGLVQAKNKLFKVQTIFIDRLIDKLGADIIEPNVHGSSVPQQFTLF